MRLPGLVHPAGDRLGDHVAGREVGELVLALHEAVALEVDEERPLAADGLADQRLLAARVGAEVHHRRVELHELEVAQHRTGTQGERHAVPGRHLRVGRLGEHLAQPARGEYDGTAAHRADAVPLPFSHHVQRDPRDPSVGRAHQVDGEGMLDDLDVRGSLDRGDERALDLRAGGVAAGMRDPVAMVAALAGQRQHALGRVVEVGAERDQLADRLGPLVDQHPHGGGVAGTRPGDEGVALVLVGAVPGPERRRDAALRPLGGAGGEHVLRDDEDLVDLVAQAERHRESGDAGADHDHVGIGGPAGLTGGESAGDRGGHPRQAIEAPARDVIRVGCRGDRFA